MSTRTLVALTTAALGAALLTACGGGGNAIPLPNITSVKVMGDSLADAGTFGIKFTVQGSAAAPEYIFPELVAQSYGLTQHCNFYVFTGTTFAANAAKTGCTNFAIGGGRINGAGARNGLGLEGGAADPRIVDVQLKTAVAAANHTANDLLLIDGGGNDAADLVGLYLATATGGAAAVGRYSTVLKSVLPAATVDSALATGAAGFASIGGTYMTALAGRFYDQIKASALDKGAKYVVVINMPAITNTPRFQAVLDGIAAANGGGAAGATARTQSEALFTGWVQAFNAELSKKVTGNSSVVLLDLYTQFNNQIASPLTYGLTNVRNTACPSIGIDPADGLPAYNFPACTSAALSALTPPAGSTGADWWRSYLFSDGFHPTPLGHQLAANQIRAALFNASWQ